MKLDAGLIIQVIWKVLKDQHNVLREEKEMREKKIREKNLLFCSAKGENPSTIVKFANLVHVWIKLKFANGLLHLVH